MFGVTDNGNSILCHVHGFEPYFYCATPPGFSPDDVDPFRKALNDRVAEATGGRQKQPLYVSRVEAGGPPPPAARRGLRGGRRKPRQRRRSGATELHGELRWNLLQAFPGNLPPFPPGGAQAVAVDV